MLSLSFICRISLLVIFTQWSNFVSAHLTPDDYTRGRTGTGGNDNAGTVTWPSTITFLTNGTDYNVVCCHKPILKQNDISYKPPKWNVKTAISDHKSRLPLPPSPSYNRTLLPLVFEPLPLGSIKPLRWQRQQMNLMANGMPGRMHEFYRMVKNAPWLGGNEEYSPLNEAFTYYWNGIVPLAYGLDDDRLKPLVRRLATWLIEHQHDDGWLGPETDLSRRNFWGRYPLFLGFIQLAEAEPESTHTIVTAMHRFVDLMHSMLSNSYQGYVWKPGDLFDEQWGRSRAADMIISLQWLYEKYPAENAQKIHDCMVWIYEMAYDWAHWFSEDVFLKGDLDSYPGDLINSLFPYVHGVNAGQGLKYGAVMRRINNDDSLLNSTRRGVDWTFRYHGTPSGAIIGDERESGLSPRRGTELCSVVETIFSLNYLYQSLGDREFADRSELAAYNALPVMVMPRWWAHQYIAQTNQPYSGQLNQTPFWNVGPWGQTFGTEPNYPCCAMTFSTAVPKFIASSFLRDGTEGLVHALLGPAEVRTTFAKGNQVRIRCETNYPFSNYLEYKVKARHAFKFSFRVPSWAIMEDSSFWLNDGPEQRLSPDKTTGMHTIVLPAGRTKLEVNFGAKIRVVKRQNDAVSIYHGALLYSIAITGEYSNSRPGRYPGEEAPPEAADWTIKATTPWNLAIDISTLRFFEYPNRYADELPDPIWDENAAPVSISALACEIDWKMDGGIAADPPAIGQRNCTNRAFMIELRPYGSAKLHMAELPTVDLSPGSPDLWDPHKSHSELFAQQDLQASGYEQHSIDSMLVDTFVTLLKASVIILTLLATIRIIYNTLWALIFRD